MALVVLALVAVLAVFVIKLIEKELDQVEQLNKNSMLTAAEARKLQLESFTLRGKVIDAITSAAKRNESEVVIPNLNLRHQVLTELETKGYFVQGNVISWAITDSVEVVGTVVAEVGEQPLSSESNQ